MDLELKKINRKNSVLHFTTSRLNLMMLSVLVCYVLLGSATAFAQFGFIGFEPNVQRSEREAKWQAILKQPHPEIGREEETIEDLIMALSQIGLPISLHQSAQDDACTSDDLITLGQSSLPLFVRLQSSLGEVNATISISRGAISIVSQDNAWDPSLRCSRVYDVSRCTDQPKRFAEDVFTVLSEDVWDGSEAIIQILPSPKEHLMVVNAPYYFQIEVSELIKSISQTNNAPRHLKSSVANSEPVVVESDSIVGEQLSKPVQLPDQHAASGDHDGGFGGGVFSIPSTFYRAKGSVNRLR